LNFVVWGDEIKPEKDDVQVKAGALGHAVMPLSDETRKSGATSARSLHTLPGVDTTTHIVITSDSSDAAPEH